MGREGGREVSFNVSRYVYSIFLRLVGLTTCLTYRAFGAGGVFCLILFIRIDLSQGKGREGELRGSICCC